MKKVKNKNNRRIASELANKDEEIRKLHLDLVTLNQDLKEANRKFIIGQEFTVTLTAKLTELRQRSPDAENEKFKQLIDEFTAGFQSQEKQPDEEQSYSEEEELDVMDKDFDLLAIKDAKINSLKTKLDVKKKKCEEIRAKIASLSVKF